MKLDRILRFLPALLGALCLFGITHPALAQTSSPCPATIPWNAYCLQWNHDGRGTVNGVPNTALTIPVTFRVEQRLGTNGTWTPVVSGLTTTRAYLTNLAVGTYYFLVYANCNQNCNESAPSALSPATGITPPPTQPNPPVIIIAVTISENAPPTAVQVNGAQVYASARP